eukprot:m.476324 g.476324  ORF g.476324 m.476324 type:complete len:203 (-) comp20499_c0_seq1:110-718(-)
MVFEKQIVIDARGHLLGRLASIVAKELLSGQKIVVVRCEEINMSGSFYRNKLKYHAFLRKRTNTKPSKGGPFHFRAPGRIFWRTVRGMLPHKTARGVEALKRLKSFEGVPPPYDKVKRVVVPAALRNARLAPGRNFCTLGRLSFEVGWKYKDVVQELEAKRKVKSAEFYAEKKKEARLRKAAAENKSSEIAQFNTTLAELGF